MSSVVKACQKPSAPDPVGGWTPSVTHSFKKAKPPAFIDQVSTALSQFPLEQM